MDITNKIDNYLMEASDKVLQQVASIIKGINLVDMREPLEQSKMFKKKDIDFMLSPMPMFVIKYKGKKIGITNKKNADASDLVVGDIAIGYM